jgi:hypothetical protein
MLTRHVSRHLAAYLDSRLSPSTARRVERHLQTCAKCQGERDQIAQAMTAIEHLPLAEAPAGVWSAIENRLREAPAAAPALHWRWAWAGVALVLVSAAAYWRFAPPSGPRWAVTPVAGAPLVAARPLHGEGRVAAGQWIETDASSRAAVEIGALGSVEVAPNTRLRVISARPGENRLALARGAIHASIYAPPKLFFVDTAAGTAVDLGCEYALNTDENGDGWLHVTRGWVAFEWKGLESMVPAGASCRTRAAAGPGIPYFDDAPEPFRQALDFFTQAKSVSDPLDQILSSARVRDTLSLWHLLSRVEPAHRSRVLDRIAALTPLPGSVSRSQVLQLDPDSLRRLREELAWKW